MTITLSILDNLTAQAKASPRLRMNMDLRNSADGTLSAPWKAAPSSWNARTARTSR